MITTFTGLVLFVGTTVPNKTNDKMIIETQYAFPHPCLLWQDTGYQGNEPRNRVIIQPAKKPQWEELTAD